MAGLPEVDPKKRWLIQTASNGKQTIFPYKAKWATRKDMKEYDPIAKKAIELERTVNINVNGTAFSVSPYLGEEFEKHMCYVRDLEVRYKALLEDIKGGAVDPGDQNDTPEPKPVTETKPQPKPEKKMPRRKKKDPETKSE